jgi:hypothetical protein
MGTAHQPPATVPPAVSEANATILSARLTILS